MSHEVFVSYAHQDKPIADAVCFTLEAKGIPCWIAPRDVHPGTSWGEAIIDGLSEARVMVLVFTSHSNESPQVTREVERAVSNGIAILQLKIEDVPLSKTMEYFISARHWLDAMTPPLEQHLQKLGGSVQFLLSRSDSDKEGNGLSVSPTEPIRKALTFERLDREPEVLVGSQIGSYVLQAPVGKGGSGFVYRAWNLALGREACVKIFRPLRQDFAALASTIARGVRGLASLDHPNLIQVLNFGRYDLDNATSFYLAMEFVHGKPLDEWSRELPDGESSTVARLRLALRLTQALQAAHTCKYVDEVGFQQTGVLHGDIKPANILVRPDNTPVLLDFMMVNVQRLLDLPVLPPPPLAGLNRQTTAIFGTPDFMAPEQEAKGVVSVSTDIYSLGITLSILFEKEVRQSTERALSHMLATMTCEDPESRPKDMATVFQRLTQAHAVAETAPQEVRDEQLRDGLWARFRAALGRRHEDR